MKTQMLLVGATAVIPLAMIVASSSGCNEKASDNGSTTPDPTVGVVDDSLGFKVLARQDPNYTYYTHRGAESGTTGPTYSGSLNWDHECTAAVGDDVMCYVEAAEYDLQFNGLVLQHNVQSSMCTYLEISYPWHYKAAAGFGPTFVSYDEHTVNGVSSINDVANSALGVPYCPFNHGPSGPNCCQGNYQLYVTTSVTPVPTSPVPPPVSSNVDWGGKISDCASGAAMDVMPKDKEGFPMVEVFYVAGQGINGIHTIDAPLKHTQGSNIYAANYFDISLTTDYFSLTDVFAWFVAGGAGGSAQIDYPPAVSPNANPYISGRTSFNVPGSKNAAGNPIAVTGLIGAPETEPYYRYTCYNNYKEVIARIRLMVRSWDLKGNMVAGNDYNPDYRVEGGVGGNEPRHDMMVFGDVFFNYTDGASTPVTLRKNYNRTSSCTSTSNLNAPCQVGYANVYDGFAP